ncbi:hypothetical protein M406DRAFT_332931 [Cryphonectria parasitica EP155]|uniref:DUF6594 domain-containing protein n=1 Tax=Cryphonectria parasitica (strain ATCC 38755 / EP155) TaxID=660469 RepID=A0A9P4XX91_CRYP1|nr:uncharacterized protein M406DRAFT_332931 [Cryphonectria parasitica EP155]KAF3762551.1 hypothetical protein M406DRAFT_332931 [Cryphonectria parasitica EP155]
MSVDLTGLDAIERGENTHSSGGGAENPQASGAPTQPRSSTILSNATENVALEQASGPYGFARVKDYDHRFTFYPGFAVERCLVLEYRAKEIELLSKDLKTVSKDLLACDKGEPNTKWTELMSRLAESIAQYDAEMLRAKKMVSYSETPEESSLDQLRLWLSERWAGQLDMYQDKKACDFWSLAPTRGPIERLVKGFMPVTRLGSILLRPFRSHSPPTPDLEFLRYEDADLSWVVGFVLLLVICIFLVLPLAVLSYFDSSHNVRTIVVLVMCFLVSILARAIETNEARQVVLVCAYSAIMSGFLSQYS